MLQAVLISLSGYDSPHIEIIKEKSRYTAFERKKIRFLDKSCSILGINKSEKQMLEEILVLGIHVKELQAFIKQYEYRKSLNGLYVMTLCHGIRELIDEYKHQIILFRRTYGISPLSEQSVSVCRLQRNFRKYLHLFECINNKLCREITDQHLFGGQIFGKLLDLVTLNGGVQFIQQKLNVLLRKILFIWYNQITSFVAYGVLSDSYSEFFINQNETYCTSKQDATQKHQLLSWNNQFLINYRMLPIKHVPNHIVDEILFIGKAVRILNAFQYKKENATATGTQSVTQTVSPQKDVVMDRDDLTSTVSSSLWNRNGLNGIKLMLTEEEMFALSQELHALKSDPLPFNVHRLESVLSRIKHQIARKLWAVLVFHLRLNRHLQTLRDYFLLGNGTFWQCLLDECTDIPALETIPVTVATRDLNFGPFKSTATKLDLQNDEFLQKINLEFSVQKWSTKRKSIDLDHIVTNANCQKVSRRNDVMFRFGANALCRNGSCWMKLKCPVRYGFRCRFLVTAPPESGNFAVVLQHDRMNWWLQHDHSHDVYGSDIARNSLVIGFRNDWRSKIQSVELFAVRSNGKKSPIEAPTDINFVHCFDGKPHAIGIVFAFSESELKVTVDDELVLFANRFKVKQYVQTELATGRAWIGITTSSPSNHRGNGRAIAVDDGKESVIEITDWSFSGKFRFEDFGDGDGDGDESWKCAMTFWSRLNLEYKIANPMDVVFNAHDLERYNGLFQFLLLLKRTHHQINKCWKAMSIEVKRREQHLPLSPVWAFILSASRKMLFFVNNLQFYIQFEVIDIEYKALLHKIEGADDIELVMEAHQQFLHSLCRQCFLIGNDRLWHYISKLLCLVLQSTQRILLCVEQQQWQNPKFLDHFESEIKALQKSFDAALAQWIELAKNISLNQQSLYKMQRLVSQLNYNGWFL